MLCDGLNLLKPDSGAGFRWLDVLLDRVKQMFGDQYVGIASRDACPVRRDQKAACIAGADIRSKLAQDAVRSTSAIGGLFRGLILAYDVKEVLADIDANHGDCSVQCLGHGVLLVFGAPSQHLTLVGGRSTAGPFH